MLERIWSATKIFLTSNQHPWLQHHILYLAILLGITAIGLGIYCSWKINKEIKEQHHQSDQETRKIGKKLLKFLSKKKNTTW